MGLFVLRRVMQLAPTVLLLVLVVFMTLHMAPGDPVDLLYDPERVTVSEETIEAKRRELGLDRPIPVQFVNYLGRVLRGDLGLSFTTRGSVAAEIARNFPATIELALAGTLVSILIGLPAGIIAALYRDSWIDFAALSGAVVGLAAPNFWLGLLLLVFFGHQLRWFPIITSGEGTWTIQSLRSVVLPAVTVGTASAALLARLTRASVLEVLRQDYVRTAWSKGLSRNRVVAVHVMRNAAIPIITALGLSMIGLLGGSVIVEVVFTRKGLGWLLVGAINNRDFPIVQGLILVYGVMIVVLNMLVDLMYGLLDPRITYE